MKSDLFISYAWTSESHREWVHLFASHLHLSGYAIKIDEAVEYGSSLNGFMREVTEAAHVLLIIDDNYVYRANNMPDSGVGIETKWISEAFLRKPNSWLSVIFVQNPERKLPDWLVEHNPKGFDFNCCPDKDDFPGSVQIDAVWRWIEGLPADKSHAIQQSTLRDRAARLELISNMRDPANYTNPALNGRVTFCYNDHPFYRVGYGEHHFDIMIDEANSETIRIYKDYGLEAVWFLPESYSDPLDYKPLIRPTRTVSLEVSQKAVLMNSTGIVCVITIEEIQPEVKNKEFIREHVTFSYEIIYKH